MRSKSDFWLDLHRLADDLRKEGASDDERITGIVGVLESLSPAAQYVYCCDLKAAATALNAIEVQWRTEGMGQEPQG